ncbi:hypothetical protein EZS27_028187 [termite gut metagenome]|uniref:Uncharacterized protein n=1 Tax=termite gut metagenome TaxID=433724 RepID=A0A5J4QM27_9ZZZZ
MLIYKDMFQDRVAFLYLYGPNIKRCGFKEHGRKAEYG